MFIGFILPALALVSLIPATQAHVRHLYVGATLQSPTLSVGFGINITKYPFHMWEGGDAGGDAPFFSRRIEWVENPPYPCGMNDELGVIDVDSFLSQSESKGLASTAPDGSMEPLLFQVNRDGACPNQCPGIKGMWQADRVNHTLSVHIPPNTKCTGGRTGYACILRIRAGWVNRFGGCFGIKMANAPPAKSYRVDSGPTSNGGTLSPSQINSIAERIVVAMDSKSILTDKATKVTKQMLDSAASALRSLQSSQAPSAAGIEKQYDAITQKALSILKANNKVLVK